MGIPVVVIRGFLEAGKTQFITNSLLNGDFGDLGKTLILALEEGEVEYDDDVLKKVKANVVTISDKNSFTEPFIREQIKQYKPQVVFIEANEMWDFDSIALPSYFDVQQVMAIVDGTTFDVYYNNMRQRFVDMVKASEIVLINRCEPTEQTSQYKRKVKFANQACAVLALDENGNELKLESDLPYSLKDEYINIKMQDFGIFYIDTFESKERYEGKMVEFDCMAVFDRKLPPKSFIAGRLAMTCCVDDIQLIGHLCAYKGDLTLKNKGWIHLKAIIHYLKFRGAKEEQLVFEMVEATPIVAPDDEFALVTLR